LLFINGLFLTVDHMIASLFLFVNTKNEKKFVHAAYGSAVEVVGIEWYNKTY
jgi:hypothetical protein